MAGAGETAARVSAAVTRDIEYVQTHLDPAGRAFTHEMPSMTDVLVLDLTLMAVDEALVAASVKQVIHAWAGSPLDPTPLHARAVIVLLGLAMAPEDACMALTLIWRIIAECPATGQGMSCVLVGHGFYHAASQRRGLAVHHQGDGPRLWRFVANKTGTPLDAQVFEVHVLVRVLSVLIWLREGSSDDRGRQPFRALPDICYWHTTPRAGWALAMDALALGHTHAALFAVAWGALHANLSTGDYVNVVALSAAMQSSAHAALLSVLAHLAIHDRICHRIALASLWANVESDGPPSASPQRLVAERAARLEALGTQLFQHPNASSEAALAQVWMALLRTWCNVPAKTVVTPIMYTQHEWLIPGGDKLPTIAEMDSFVRTDVVHRLCTLLPPLTTAT